MLKQPSSVVYFEIPKSLDETTGGDLQQLLSFSAAFIGTWMRSKLSLWVSLFFLFSSFANMRSKSANYMQLIINMGLIVMGFFSLYFWMPPQMNKPDASQS